MVTVPSGFQKLKTYLLQLFLCVALSIVLGSIIVLWTGDSPVQVYTALIREGFFTERGLMIAVQRATPLILTTAGATIAFRAGAINMGIVGQFLVGGAVAAMAGHAFAGLPKVVHLPLVLLLSAVGGAAAGWVPAVFKRISGISEVITGMIANLLIPYLLNSIINSSDVLSSARMGASRGGVPDSAQFRQFVEITQGRLGAATHAHTGIFLAVGVALFLAWWIRHTKLGFETRMTKNSFTVAEFVGINASRKFYVGMMLSGAIAALGGASEVLGVWRSYRLGTVAVGEKGLVLALVGAQDFIGSMIAAMLYGGLESGALNVSWTTHITRPVNDILVELIIILAALPSTRALFMGTDSADTDNLGGQFVQRWR